MAKELKQKTTAPKATTKVQEEYALTAARAKENKTKKVSLSFKPSLWEEFLTLASIEKVSPNEYVAQLIEKTLEDNREMITAYREFKEKYSK